MISSCSLLCLFVAEHAVWQHRAESVAQLCLLPLLWLHLAPVRLLSARLSLFFLETPLSGMSPINCIMISCGSLESPLQKLILELEQWVDLKISWLTGNDLQAISFIFPSTDIKHLQLLRYQEFVLFLFNVTDNWITLSLKKKKSNLKMLPWALGNYNGHFKINFVIL